ncbi:MAG: hypothetical protein HN337_07910 [Deltaproteobacteria bacterium]|jgi:hypothetical protein|nr:hypothetical protein [Deltaproteobacteria bacterium]
MYSTHGILPAGIPVGMSVPGCQVASLVSTEAGGLPVVFDQIRSSCAAGPSGSLPTQRSFVFWSAGEPARKDLILRPRIDCNRLVGFTLWQIDRVYGASDRIGRVNPSRKWNGLMHQVDVNKLCSSPIRGALLAAGLQLIDGAYHHWDEPLGKYLPLYL